MSRLPATRTSALEAYLPRQRHLPVIAALAVLLLMYGVGAIRYPGFTSGQVVLSLFIDNAYLIVVAVGMTFVILTGGIDLSVGSVMALSAMLSAVLVEHVGIAGPLAILASLAAGTLLGAAMGVAIHHFALQPFIVTLAGLFLARGLTYTLSVESIPMDERTFTWLAQTQVPLPDGYFLSISAVVALGVVAVAFYLLHYTRLGRNVYAVGGNEQSALLMGLPVGRTKVTVYAISGFCAALAGVIFSLYTLSGYSRHAIGMELDAVAAVVIGGTLLTGGYGYVLGTLLGSLVLGLIQTVITFQGTLSAWWTKIVIGVLLFVFILLQKIATGRRRT